MEYHIKKGKKMKLNQIASDEKFTSYLLMETDNFKKYVIVGKEDDTVEISCRDKITDQIYSVYLRKIDIKNLYETLKEEEND